jgi:hypothetical protein
MSDGCDAIRPDSGFRLRSQVLPFGGRIGTTNRQLRSAPLEYRAAGHSPTSPAIWGPGRLGAPLLPGRGERLRFVLHSARLGPHFCPQPFASTIARMEKSSRCVRSSRSRRAFANHGRQRAARSAVRLRLTAPTTEAVGFLPRTPFRWVTTLQSARLATRAAAPPDHGGWGRGHPGP